MKSNTIFPPVVMTVNELRIFRKMCGLPTQDIDRKYDLGRYKRRGKYKKVAR